MIQNVYITETTAKPQILFFFIVISFLISEMLSLSCMDCIWLALPDYRNLYQVFVTFL